MDSRDILEMNILVVDDDDSNLEAIKKILVPAGYRNVHFTAESNEGLCFILNGWADLVLLDLRMPPPNGFEILAAVRDSHGALRCPILVFTADTFIDTKRRALKYGASDFLTKPGDETEILLRVKHFLELRKLHKDLEAMNRTLEDKVVERTEELWDANLEVVHRLARAAEYRDDMTGAHIGRVASLSHGIALQIGLSERDAELIRLAAPLHDVGKIALPDSILLKKSPLTVDEREAMKRHTVIGAGILASSKSELLKLAEVIALTHHERWDGTGYPRGLTTYDIPLPGRIVAVADVFDALITTRPYKEAWTLDEALDEIKSCAGSQFDPTIVNASISILEEVDCCSYWQQ